MHCALIPWWSRAKPWTVSESLGPALWMGCTSPLTPVTPAAQHFPSVCNSSNIHHLLPAVWHYCFTEVKKGWPLFKPGCFYHSFDAEGFSGPQGRTGDFSRLREISVCYWIWGYLCNYLVIHLWVHMGLGILDMTISCTETPLGYSSSGTRYAIRGKSDSSQVQKQGFYSWDKICPKHSHSFN